MTSLTFDLIVENKKAFEKPEIFISGFHGLGSVGYISIKHLIDELKLERVAVLKSNAAPPFISLTESGRLALAFEFYATKDFRVLLFFPRLPPYRHLETEFSNKLAEWVISNNFKQAVLVGGVDKRLREDADEEGKKKDQEAKIKYIPTRQFLDSSKNSPKVNENLLTTGLFVQGPLAVMLANFDVFKFPAIGILSYAERDRPDPEGAANAIHEINNMLEISCPVDELLKNAQLFEEEILKNASMFPTSEDSGGPPETYT
jgi:uncharacterized protein